MCAIIPVDAHIWELARVVCEMPYDDVCGTAVFKRVARLYWRGGGKYGEIEGAVRYSLQATTLAGSEQTIARMRQHVAHCPGVHFSSASQAFVFASFEDIFGGTLSLLRAAACGAGSGGDEHEKLAVFETFMRNANNVVDVMDLVDMMDELL
jgi:hypothetical protein